MFRNLLEKHKDIIAYIIFGVLTTIVNILVYHTTYDLAGIANIPSTLIAWIAAVTFAFFTNKVFVFESKSWEIKLFFSEMIKFYGCRIGTGIIEVGMMYVLVDVLCFNGTLMKLITNIIVIILNYIFSKFIIFYRKS